MKALVVLLRPKYVQNYEPVLRVLADRGHRVHVTFTAGRAAGGRKRFDTAQLEELAAAYPQAVTWDDGAPERGADGWRGIAELVRMGGDVVRYAEPRYKDAPLLRERVVRRFLRAVDETLPRPLAAAVAGLVRALMARPHPGVARALLRLARDAERAIPPSAEIDDYIRSHAPDVVVVSPLVDVASNQADYLKSATALGIPAVLAVASWDNLTNKGVVRNDPDGVLVWNEAQRREAAELHAVDPARVIATGAPKFDEWFVRESSLDRDAFAARVGLPKAGPYVLYVCSSHFIAPHEPAFVERWLEALRAGALGDIGVLVRPHPENAESWEHVDLARFGNVTVYPRAGAMVDDDEARADFFHSLAHSAAVVGVNTSAMIEAAIVGKSVYSVLDPQFRDTQEGTLHFRHLLRENGGVLHVASSLDEHVRQLAQDIAQPEEPAELRAFVESFVRPHGVDRPAAPILADAIEELAAGRGRPPVTTSVSRALHGLLAPVAAFERLSARPPEQADRLAGKQVELRLAPLRRRSRILVGPWLRDPVEEALYWLPFVRHLSEVLDVDPSRLVAVSYGGAEAWYADLCGGYADLDELLGPGTAGRALAARVPEQARIRAAAAAKLGLSEREAFRPADLRRVTHGFRTGATPVDTLLEFLRPAAIGPARTRGDVVAVDAAVAADVTGLVEGRRTVAVANADRGALAATLMEATLFVGAADGLGPLGPAFGVDTVVVTDGRDDRPEADLDLAAWTARKLGTPYSLVAAGTLGLLAAATVADSAP